MRDLWRVTHHKDPVPQVPFASWGFFHEPTEVRPRNPKHTPHGAANDKGGAPDFQFETDVIF
jgi:hypothetical protein